MTLPRELDDRQIERYARHLVLPEIGEEGQEKLLNSRVLVVGAGGLGSPILLYLAAAGIGHLGVVDDDTVDLSNLHRQILHDENTLDQPKVASAAQRLTAINPDVEVTAHATRLTAENTLDLFSDYDLIVDGSDNFATRYLVNDAAFLAGKTLVTGAIMRFDGQLTVVKAHEGHGDDDKQNPCYRCLFGNQPSNPKDSCADVGVLGALPGIIGSLQAIETVKELLGIGQSLSGRLILYDALAASFQTMKAPADPGCKLCGNAPEITSIQAETYTR